MTTRSSKGRLLDLPRKDGSYPFEYRNSASTDVAVTIAREQARLREKQPVAVPSDKVQSLNQARRKI